MHNILKFLIRVDYCKVCGCAKRVTDGCYGNGMLRFSGPLRAFPIELMAKAFDSHPFVSGSPSSSDAMDRHYRRFIHWMILMSGLDSTLDVVMNHFTSKLNIPIFKPIFINFSHILRIRGNTEKNLLSSPISIGFCYFSWSLHKSSHSTIWIFVWFA